MPNQISSTEGLILDLDDCLYPQPGSSHDGFSKASRITLSEAYPHLSSADIDGKTKESFKKYGNDIAAFSAEYGYPNGKPYMELYQIFHRYAFGFLKDMFVPQEGLYDIMLAIKGHTKSVVLTHAPREWAIGALNLMGLTEFLPAEAIISQDDPEINGMRKDRDPETFRIALKHLGLEANQVTFLDDTEKNHLIARQIGLYNVLVHWNTEYGTSNLPEHIDETSLGPVPYLRKLVR